MSRRERRRESRDERYRERDTERRRERRRESRDERGQSARDERQAARRLGIDGLIARDELHKHDQGKAVLTLLDRLERYAERSDAYALKQMGATQGEVSAFLQKLDTGKVLFAFTRVNEPYVMHKDGYHVLCLPQGLEGNRNISDKAMMKLVAHELGHMVLEDATMANVRHDLMRFAKMVKFPPFLDSGTGVVAATARALMGAFGQAAVTMAGTPIRFAEYRADRFADGLVTDMTIGKALEELSVALPDRRGEAPLTIDRGNALTRSMEIVRYALMGATHPPASVRAAESEARLPEAAQREQVRAEREAARVR